MMSNKKYWSKRQEQKYLDGEQSILEYYKGLESCFKQAQKEIQGVLDTFYARYMKENGINSFTEAQKLLNKREIGDLQDYINKVKEHMGTYNLELNNMSLKARITRYEGLQKQIDAVLQQLYSLEYEKKGSDALQSLYEESYFKTWFNIDQYNGFHSEFAQIDPAAVNQLISYPFNGANFSDRLWKQKDFFLQQLKEATTTMIVQGKNPNVLAADFAKKFNAREFDAKRLLHTEASYIMEQASQDMYEEAEFEEYEWVATLDSKTCEQCQPLDGKVFTVGKGVVGETLTPKHCFCRCTTVPCFDDEEETTRVARDVNGKNVNVPADMTYEKWHKEHVENNPDYVIKEKKYKNRYQDKLQFEKYKEILGSEAPKTLENFQNLKYNEVNDFEKLRTDKQEKINSLNFEKMGHLVGKLNKKETRIWYKVHDENIPNLLDSSKSIKEQATQACSLRNLYRTQARDLMKDQVKRKELDEKHPNMTFDQLVEYKKLKYGLNEEDAYKDIVRSSTTTNKEYDKISGIKEE